MYLKYAGDNLYLAWAMSPTCGCSAFLAFNPNGSTVLDGTQFGLGIFDDPFGTDGDASEIDSTGSSWGAPGQVGAGILITNPPNQPNTVTYELSIPFAKLGLTPGHQRSLGFGLYHSNSGQWPTDITIAEGANYPSDPTQWGLLSSSANWQ